MACHLGPVAIRVSLRAMTTKQAIEFPLRGDHIALCDLLKLAGVADSGGQGKAMVAAGEVSVDGCPEIRKTAKIRAGQRVECRGTTILVTA
jgi:ribosome-associated protein